jgi:hypothetical protein
MREDPGVQLSPTHEDAVRRLDRLAGRLRVAGPRLAAREGAEAVSYTQLRAHQT